MSSEIGCLPTNADTYLMLANLANQHKVNAISEGISKKIILWTHLTTSRGKMENLTKQFINQIKLTMMGFEKHTCTPENCNLCYFEPAVVKRIGSMRLGFESSHQRLNSPPGGASVAAASLLKDDVHCCFIEEESKPIKNKDWCLPNTGNVVTCCWHPGIGDKEEPTEDLCPLHYFPLLKLN